MVPEACNTDRSTGPRGSMAAARTAVAPGTIKMQNIRKRETFIKIIKWDPNENSENILLCNLKIIKLKQRYLVSQKTENWRALAVIQNV